MKKILIYLFLLIPILGFGQETETGSDGGTYWIDAVLTEIRQGDLYVEGRIMRIIDSVYSANWQNDTLNTTTRKQLFDKIETIVSNAYHSGDAEGSTILTLQGSAISNKGAIAAIAGDYLLVWDATDGLLKKADASQFLGGGGGGTRNDTLIQDSIWVARETSIEIWRDTIRVNGAGGGHNPVTLAGAYDYLTLSNQEITLGLISLNTDIVGDLATANIENDAVTNAKLDNMDNATIKGRNTAGVGDPANLLPSEVRSIINVEYGAAADQTNSEIKTAYENNANTNEFDDAEQTKLANLTGTNTGDEVQATTSIQGIAELATVTEVDNGSDNERIITPWALENSQLSSDVSTNNAKITNSDTTSWLMDNDSILDVKVLGVHFRYDTIRLAGTGGGGDGNNHVTGIDFNTSDGILTLNRNGLSDLTQDLDGRYLESFTEVDGSITNEHQDLTWNNGTNTIEINDGTNAIITGFSDDTHNHDHNQLTGLQVTSGTNYWHLTNSERTELLWGGTTAVHHHDSDRDRANHTGTQTASTISDFDTEVTNNASVVANTAKITNTDDQTLSWNNILLQLTIEDGNVTTLSHNHDASHINTGLMNDGRIAESNITQHEAALSIDANQIPLTANKLLGSGQSGTDAREIILGTNLSFSGNTLNASGGGGGTETLADIATNSTGTVEQTFALDNLTDVIFEKSDGTDILTIDGTNGIVGINATPIAGRDLTLTNYQFLRGYIGSDLYIHNDGSTTDFFAGQNAGLSTSATNSNGIGKNALLSSSGSNNDAIGVSAGSSNTGSKNVFIGNSTGIANSGADNVMVGYFAGRNKGAGAQNTYIGSNAGKNSTSSANTCIGFYAGSDNGNSFLTAVGQNSGQNSNGDDNSFFGYASGASAVGDNILGLGAYALRSSNGNNNVGIGHASSEEIEGNDNVSMGRYSLQYNKGSNNTTIGGHSMRDAGTGTNNTAIGYRAGSNMHGNDNTALGGSSLPLQLTGVTLVVSSVDVPNDRITITAHGLTIGDKYPLYVVSSTIGGLGTGNTYNFKVIDANILEVSVVDISSVGAMTLERYQEVSNSTWVGAGAYPTKSNQVVLGNANVTETLLRGGVGIGIEPTETLDVNGNVKIRGSIVTSTDDHGTVGQIPISQGADIPWIWGANGGGGGSYVARSVLVAAKNSYWNNNGADYDCDSINDEVQIIAALNYARDNNIRLVEADGDFQLDDTLKLLANYDGITLKGFGRTNTVFHGSMTADDSWIEFLFEQDTLTDFTLKDFTLDASTISDNTAGNNQGIICAKKEVYTENLTLDNIKVVGTGGYNAAISFSFEDDTKVGKFTNFTMKNCELEMDGDGKTGVYCFRMTHYSDGVDIHNNKVTILNATGGDNNFNPLSLYGSAKHFSIKDNFVYGYGQVHSCIAVSPGSKGTISGNYTYMGEPYTFESGIEVEMKRGAHTADDTDSVQYVTITGNVIESRRNNGVGGRYSCGIIVRDYDNTPDTIYPTGITILGNTIARCDYGLRIEEARDLVVSGNGFHDCGQNTYYGRTDNTPHDVGFSETHLNGLRVGNEQMSIYDTSERIYQTFLSKGANTVIFGEEIESDKANKEVTIGATDTIQLNVNGRINITGLGRSVVIGEEAGENMDVSSDRNNFYFGYRSGRYSTTGIYNVAVGANSMDDGGFNGSYNVGLGAFTLTELHDATSNIAIGHNSQAKNISSPNNVGIGFESLKENLAASNIAIGTQSMKRNTDGINNVAIGTGAFGNQTTGSYNVAIGGASMGTAYLNDVGDHNTSIGYKSGESQKGFRNTIIGAFAGDNATFQTTNDCIYIGYQAGLNNTSDDMLIIENDIHKLIEGDFNTKVLTIYDAMKVNPITAASAPSGANGMIIYVTTTDGTFTSVGFWKYEEGAWVKF